MTVDLAALARADAEHEVEPPDESVWRDVVGRCSNCGEIIRLPDLIAELTAARAEIERLRESLDWAWAVIANAGGGDWTRETRDWQAAAIRWRDDTLPGLSAARAVAARAALASPAEGKG